MKSFGREDHLLGKERDLLGPGDDGDPPRAVARSGLAPETRRSRTCFSTPASSSSTRWFSIAETKLPDIGPG